MSNKSRWIRINDYILAEYIYTDINNPELSTDDYIVVKNKYNGLNQIFNAASNTSNNIQDLTCVSLGTNQQVYLDLEKVPNYLDYDTNLEYTTYTTFTVAVDTVRFHFISGFTFDTFKGYVLSVKNIENDNKPNIFANVLVYPTTFNDLIVFNPKPIFLTDAIFDKYIDVKIPSIKLLNDDFYTSVTPNLEFAAAISPKHDTAGYKGFIKNANITISVDRVSDITLQRTNDTEYEVITLDEHKEARITQEDTYDNLNALIQDAPQGDYIEFFAEYNGAFVEDFIGKLEDQDPTANYVLIHQLSVFEQVGSAFINTAKQIFFQENAFDEPNVFRPVLKNGDVALSFSIEYLLRLINQTDGSQIIRTASYSSFEVKKWGTKIQKIQLSNAPQSHKIYNKIIKKDFESTLLFIEPSKTEAGTDALGNVVLDTTSFQTNNGTVNQNSQNVFTPIFYNHNTISAAYTNNFVKNKDNFKTLAFGQNNLWIILNPFDNVLKFNIFELKKGSQVPMNLTVSSSYNLTFLDSNSKKLRFSNLNDPNKEDLVNGELVFKIPSDDSAKILNSTNNQFYITTINKENTETVLYNGEWYKVEDKELVDVHINESTELANKNLKDEVRIEELEAQVTDLKLEVEKTNAANITTRPTIDTKGILIDIPGYIKPVEMNGAQNEVSIISQIKPTSVVIKPTNTSSTSVKNLIKPDDDISKASK